jgi:hypothetical protein
MSAREWEHWHQAPTYGELMKQRALGQAPQMEQVKQLIKLFQTIYRLGITAVDVGCGAGHCFPGLLAVGEELTCVGIDIT